MRKLLFLLCFLLPTNLTFAQEQDVNIPVGITITAKIFLVFIFLLFLSSFLLIYYANKIVKKYKNSSLIKVFFFMAFFIWLNFIIMSGICVLIFILSPTSQNVLTEPLTFTTIAVLTMILSLIFLPIIYKRFL